MSQEFLISKADGRPMYLQIMEQIRARIAVGDWPPGSELPSIRQLAVDLCVSVITVKRAYLELEREGVIQTQHGKGSFVSPHALETPHEREQELMRRLEQVLQLGSALGLSVEELILRLKRAATRD